ncbi:hypothetical protein E8E12_010059 [Didymella heteroderae]|uniref:Uncharacterized protein n=1 Tax=Didymella heteroderae TaxID=1769908 RepID=A0A9P5C6P8_9PLEO|nr:hypothetical protein E8E12_010059 [Didymella heteroderae]
MIVRAIAIARILGLVARVSADVAPEITTLAEGYNYIAKLPCIDCPYLYQDTSNGENGPWMDRIDENVLLLNVSLPLDASYLSINNGDLLTGSSSLPRIYASQVLQDFSTEDLLAKVANNDLDTAGPSAGLSYGTSISRITNSTALVYRFNIFSLHFALLQHQKQPIPLSNSRQKVLELILLPRPLHSAGDSGPGWEIISIRLCEREKKGSKRRMKMMMFEDWDEFGRKGSPLHALSSSSRGVVKYAASGFWSLSITVLSFMVAFVVVVLGVVYTIEAFNGEYDQAQKGKGRRSASKGSGSWTDVEAAKGRFLSTGELGTRSGASAVGAGKSD